MTGPIDPKNPMQGANVGSYFQTSAQDVFGTPSEFQAKKNAPVPIEQLQKQLDMAWQNYNASSGQERLDWRNFALDLDRQIRDLGGKPSDSEAEGAAPKQSNTGLPPELQYPTREQLAAYFAGRKLQGGSIDPKNLSTEQLQNIWDQLDPIERSTADLNPQETLGDFADGITGPTPEEIAEMRAGHQAELQRKREDARINAEAKVKADSEQRAREKAAAKAERDREKQEQQAEKQRLQIEQQRQKQAQLRDRVRNEVFKRTYQSVARTQVRLGSLPTPGGIQLVLFTILFIIFAIVPQNKSGATRLQLIWYAMAGQARLPENTGDQGTAYTDSGSSSPAPPIPKPNQPPSPPGIHIHPPGPLSALQSNIPAASQDTSSDTFNVLNHSVPYASL